MSCRYGLKFKLSVGLLLGIVVCMTLGPLLSLDPGFINPDLPTASPSMQHPFGTDELGRDLLARLGIGARISMLIGLATALIAVVFGTAYGTLAAFFEDRPLDIFLMRCIDVLYSLPGLMIVILISILLKKHFGDLGSLVLALSLFSWPDTARMIRAQVLSLKREAFVEAFHSLGGDWVRLTWAHFLPNLSGLMVLCGTITIPRAILTESTLSFIGLGVPSPWSSWGTMINDGWQMIRLAPHLVLLPSCFLIVTVIALHLLGESLKDLLQGASRPVS